MILFFLIMWVLIVWLAYIFGLDNGYQKGFRRAEDIFRHDRDLHREMRNGQDTETSKQNTGHFTP